MDKNILVIKAAKILIGLPRLLSRQKILYQELGFNHNYVASVMNLMSKVKPTI
jgi:hypothetical protein